MPDTPSGFQSVELLRSQFHYNTWANSRLLDVSGKLTREQFIGEHHTTFGSLQQVIVHMLTAERLWIARAQGQPPPPDMLPETYNSIESIRTTWTAIDAVSQLFLTTLTESDLERIVHYVNSRGEPQAYPLWQILFHMVNHSMQHRSEAALVMTELGQSTGWLDYLIYVDETGSLAA